MKDLIEDIKTTTWSDRTKKQRIGFLNKLKKTISPQTKDFNFLSNVADVKDHIFASPNPASRKTNILIIKSILNNSGYTQIAKKYDALSFEVITDERAHRGNNVIDPDNWITFHDVLALPKKIEADIKFVYDKLFLSEKEINNLKTTQAKYKYLKLLTDYITLVLYCWQAPVRGGDWATVLYKKPKGDKFNTENWYNVKKQIIHWNTFKNVKSFGPRSFKLEKEVAEPLDAFIDILDFILDDSKYILNSIGLKNYISYSRESFSTYISRLLLKYSGKKISVNTLRHIYESYLINHRDYNKLTNNQKDEIHERLLHTRQTAGDYLLIEK